MKTIKFNPKETGWIRIDGAPTDKEVFIIKHHKEE